jgi:hypothetical protein
LAGKTPGEGKDRRGACFGRKADGRTSRGEASRDARCAPRGLESGGHAGATRRWQPHRPHLRDTDVLFGIAPKSGGVPSRRAADGQHRMSRLGAASDCARSHEPSAENGAVWGTEEARRPHERTQALTADPRVGRRGTRKVSAEASMQRGCARGSGREATVARGHRVGGGSPQGLQSPARKGLDPWRGVLVGRSRPSVRGARRVSARHPSDDGPRGSSATRDDGREASGRKAQESIGCGTAGNGRTHNGLTSGARPRGRVGVATDDGEGAKACGDVGHGCSGGKGSGGWSIGGNVPNRRDAAEDRNPVNPMVGSRMQQACERLGGGSRRGGENPRGRNMSGVWQRQAEAHREVRGSGHRAGRRRRGDL